MAERKKREADIILQSQLGGFEQPDCLDFSHSFEMTSTFNGHFDRAKRREILKVESFQCNEFWLQCEDLTD